METEVRFVLVRRANDAMDREQLESRTDLLVAQRISPRRHGWPLNADLSAARKPLNSFRGGMRKLESGSLFRFRRGRWTLAILRARIATEKKKAMCCHLLSVEAE